MAKELPFVGLDKDGWARAQSINFDPDRVRASATKKVVALFADGQWHVEVSTRFVAGFNERDRGLIARSIQLSYQRLIRFYSKLTRSEQKERIEKGQLAAAKVAPKSVTA